MVIWFKGKFLLQNWETLFIVNCASIIQLSQFQKTFVIICILSFLSLHQKSISNVITLILMYQKQFGKHPLQRRGRCMYYTWVVCVCNLTSDCLINCPHCPILAICLRTK